MWLSVFGYYLIGKGQCHSFSRTFHMWFIFWIICLCQFGLCQAQKDTGAFGDGIKGNNNAFQTAQKGSELGESPDRGGINRGNSNVRVSQTQESAANHNAPLPSQNVNVQPAPLGASGGGLSGASAGTEINPRPGLSGSEINQHPPLVGGRNPNAASGLQPLPSHPGTDQELEQEQSQPQQPANQPQLRPAVNKHRFASSTGEPVEEIFTLEPNTEPSVEVTEEVTASTQALIHAGKPPKSRPAGSGKVKTENGDASSLSSSGKVAKARPVKGGNNANIPNTENGDAQPKAGVANANSADANVPRPVPNSGVEETESEAHGPPAAVPNSPPVPQPKNGHQPANAGLHSVTTGPQLSPRSGAVVPVQVPQESLEPSTPATFPAGSNLEGAEAGTEDAASGALIKAVNDEYVDVVKNLTDAGVLTEADYESKPVSDLFAILLEKLINANPGATEEDQRKLVRQAGLEFVEVFKANAAITKNVTEIVRLVSDQLNSASILLNEGHADVQPGAAGIVETSTPAFNPFEATTSLKFGAGSRNSNTESIPNQNGVPIHVVTQPPNTNPFAPNRRPVGQPSQQFPGPPGLDIGSQNETIIEEATTEKSTPKHGFVLQASSIGASTPGSVAGTVSGSSPAPPPFGFQKPNGQNLNIQINSSASDNGTLLQGQDSQEVITTTQESIQDGPGAPIGNPRFPFPAHAPSTLRPPLRFFTTSTVVSNPEFGFATGSSPGRSPGSIPPGPGGRVIIGGTPNPLDNSAEIPLESTDFPTPPTWEYTTGSRPPGGVIIGDNNEGLNGQPKVVTIGPLESGTIGEVSNVSGNPFSLGNVTDEPLETTTIEETAQPPFTHEVHENFGNNSPLITTSISPLGVLANSTVPPVNGTNSTSEWLISGNGPNLIPSTPKSILVSLSTTEESFVTDSGNETETTSSFFETQFLSTLSPIIIGLQPNISNPDIAPNATNATGVFPIPISTTRDIFEITTTESSLEITETEESNISKFLNETTTSAFNATTNVLVIGLETTVSPFESINGSSESTISNIPSNSTDEPVAVTTSESEGLTTEEPDLGSGSGDNATAGPGEIGSGIEITLPTRPTSDNGSISTKESDLETSTQSTISTSSSNAFLVWGFRIVDPQTVWDSELLNKESFIYKELHSSLIKDLTNIFKTLEPKRFVDVTIKAFSKGSVVVDGQSEFNERVDSSVLLDRFAHLVEERKNTIGGRAVDPASISLDRRQYAPQAGTGNSISSGGTPNWVIALVVAIVLLALIVIAAVVVIKRRKRQTNRDNYMVDEETMNGGPKAWAPGHTRANQPTTQGQQQRGTSGNGISNGRDQYSGVNMYEMKEPATPNAHLNYGYQPDRAANGHGAHGRSVTEIQINAETNVDNEAASKH